MKISVRSELCTKVICICNPISINGDKYFFVDTPGFNNDDFGEKTKEALRYLVTNPKNRIKAILICLHIDDKGLSKSIQDMLKEFMNWFPLNDFWQHVFIISIHKFEFFNFRINLFYII